MGCRRGNGEARRWSFPARGLGSLDGPSKGTRRVALSRGRGIIFWAGALAAVLLARLDDLSLSLSYIETALELLAHGGVLGVETGRQACEADVHEVRTALA
jgi:hypothetical protein